MKAATIILAKEGSDIHLSIPANKGNDLDIL